MGIACWCEKAASASLEDATFTVNDCGLEGLKRIKAEDNSLNLLKRPNIVMNFMHPLVLPNQITLKIVRIKCASPKGGSQKVS